MPLKLCFKLSKRIFLVAVIIIALLLLTTYYNAAFAQEKKGLVIVSDNGFNDNDPNLPQYHIVGEVQNNGSESAFMS